MLRVDPDADQHWRSRHVGARLLAVGILLLYGFGRLQQHLPLSLGFPALPADGSWNTAVSFVTNTNWQWYSGEAALGHLMQMSGLTVQNFVSAAVGMGIAAAFARALARSKGDGRVGNFWADLVRGMVRVLLPISMAGAHPGPLRSGPDVGHQRADDHPHGRQPGADHRSGRQPGGDQGARHQRRRLLQRQLRPPVREPDGVHQPVRDLPDPADPLAMAWPSATSSRTAGRASPSGRHGALLGISIALLTWAEMAGPGSAPGLAGGAMEGKEVRFGTAASALFGAATTGTSTGAVNSMHDSFTAPGGGVALFNMMLGEIAPGGVGAGLYGMLMLAVVTVFLAGLMVGRTPSTSARRSGSARSSWSRSTS